MAAEPMEQFLLKPRLPPLLFWAGAFMAVGAVLIAAGSAGWVTNATPWRIAGYSLGGLGVIGVVVALISRRRQQVWVELDDQGYLIADARGEFTGSWQDVTQVIRSRRGDKLALTHDKQRRTVIAHPARVATPELAQLQRAIERHLNNPAG